MPTDFLEHIDNLRAIRILALRPSVPSTVSSRISELPSEARTLTDRLAFLTPPSVWLPSVFPFLMPSLDVVGRNLLSCPPRHFVFLFILGPSPEFLRLPVTFVTLT